MPCAGGNGKSSHGITQPLAAASLLPFSQLVLALLDTTTVSIWQRLTKLVIYEVLWRTELLQKRYDSFKMSPDAAEISTGKIQTAKANRIFDIHFVTFATI